MREGIKRMGWGGQKGRDVGHQDEKQVWALVAVCGGPSRGGERSDDSVRNPVSGRQRLNCRGSGGKSWDCGREKAALPRAGGAGQPGAAPGLGKGVAKSRAFVLPATNFTLQESWCSAAKTRPQP